MQMSSGQMEIRSKMRERAPAIRRNKVVDYLITGLGIARPGRAAGRFAACCLFGWLVCTRLIIKMKALDERLNSAGPN
jgi:hypothetical protein